MENNIQFIKIDKTMDRPLVSVIMPCYNSRSTIKDSISSILFQSYSNIELIVVDDGSTDNSVEEIEKLKDSRIKILQQKNCGGGAARNLGLKRANGKYIQFVDADDLLSSHKIELQVDLLEQNPGKVSVCNTVFFYDGENPYVKKPDHNSDFLYDTDDPVDFLVNLYGGKGKAGMVQTNAWLSPRSVIKKSGLWNEELAIDQDGEFFCRVLLSSKGVAYSKEGFNYYRKFKNRSSVSKRDSRRANEDVLKAIQLKSRFLLTKADKRKVGPVVSRMYKEFAVSCYPKFRDLSAIALAESDRLGGSDFVPTLGGEGIELVKRLLGWKLAKEIAYAKNKFYFK